MIDRSVPYPPSWINRLHAWIDGLPVPAWVAYLAAFLVVAFVGNAVAWADGYGTVGSFDLFVTTSAFFLVLGYGSIHYIDRIASGSWLKFRPLMSLDDAEGSRAAYELTTMPARPVRACTVRAPSRR